jgi:hypothetical protein
MANKEKNVAPALSKHSNSNVVATTSANNNSGEGLGCFGVLVYLFLSAVLTPLGALAIAYFVFRGKEKQKWETSKTIFFIQIILIVVWIGFWFLMLAGLMQAFAPHNIAR